MKAGEAEGAPDLLGTKANAGLQEPERILRVAAVVETVQTEVDDLARRERSRRAGRCTADRVVRQRVAGGEGVHDVVLVRQSAGPVLPGPVRDVLRVLGAAAGEDRRVQIAAEATPSRCSGRDAGGGAVARP